MIERIYPHRYGDSAESAAYSLAYYFRLATANNENVKWNSDNESEVCEIVKDIINAAVEEMEKEGGE